MDKKEALEKVRAYKTLLKDYFPVESVYLFGSYTKNTQHEDSDIDVAIVVNHIDADFFSVNPLLWKLRRQIDHRIEPILIEKDYDPADFLSEIKKNGIEIN
jgi:predicted nucleotidyltransferase